MNALRIGFLLLGLVVAAGARADENFWLGLKGGTLGLGVEGNWSALPWIDLRAGFNTFEYDHDGSEAGIGYDATLDLQTYYATANFHVPLSPFRFTAGVFNNGNELNLVSAESGPVEVGGTTFSADEVGTLRAAATFDDVAPYAGLGFDFGVLDKIGLSLDAGVLFQGDPDVMLTSDGTLANNPVFQQELEEERVELEDEVDRYKLYPVVSLTFRIPFL